MKRFTETLKWEDQWFRRLSLEHKTLWGWLLDKCDNAGVIEPDLELASFQIGYQYPMDTLSGFGDRVVKLPSGKHFIPKFIEFQYGKLSRECKAHNPIFISLEKHGLKGYPKGIHTLQEKEKEKEQEEEEPKGMAKAKGTRAEFVAFAVSLSLPANDGEFLHDHFLESGWKRGKEPIKDWKAAFRKWKSGGWLPSQKNSNQPKAQGSLSKNFTSSDVGI